MNENILCPHCFSACITTESVQVTRHWGPARLPYEYEAAAMTCGNCGHHWSDCDAIEALAQLSYETTQVRMTVLATNPA